MDLFDQSPDTEKLDRPLADRMRPQSLDEFIGQEHLLGPGRPFRRELESGRIRSMILWGPPGSGKTTLARLMADFTDAEFVPFHAASEGVPALRKRIAEAQERRKLYRRGTVLFLDEIHRFNKSQQDALLPYVEDGTITLIGATTENPSFELTPPLLSRCRVVLLYPLEPEQVRAILERALRSPHGLADAAAEVEPEVLDRIVLLADGDARTALNLLESVVEATPLQGGRRHVTLEALEGTLRRHGVRHDKSGDSHYQLASALIKSIRGSDPDAALYWLARLLEGGEDPRFIARRLVISASEDVGNADPLALLVATGAAHAVEYVGLPEAQINLAQAVTYLASAPKSNAAYAGLMEARRVVQEEPAYAVPLHLRNAVTALQRRLGYGQGYRYAHDAPDSFLPQDHLPEPLRDRIFYRPKAVGAEAKIAERLERWRRLRAKGRESPPKTGTKKP